MSRLRLTRMRVLLGLVVVLLATVPVLVPLLWTNSDGATAPETLRAVAEPGRPALPRDDGASPGATAALPRAGVFASPSPGRTTPSPTPSATTPAAPSPTAAPDPTPSPATPSPSDTPTAAPRVAAAGSDLVVVSVGWSPNAPAAGQPVVFAAVVRNAGSDPTPAVTHGIAFSVDGSEVTWSANSSDPLAPGEERTYTADGGNAGNAWTAIPGRHTVQAWADDLDRIPETDENNNTATATLTITLL